MRLFLLACEVLARPLYLCAAHSPHTINIQLVPMAQHNTPLVLRKTLQTYINNIQDYDAILLGYGLCGQATAGLVAQDIQLVVPRAHDCITLFLGGRDRYNEQFEKCPGTYWYVQDYIERAPAFGVALSIGASLATDLDETYAQYVEKYGQDNADYLMEVMGAWQQHYQRAAFIDMGISDGEAVIERAKSDAARRGWSYDQMPGDLVLLRRLLLGEWEDDFLIVPPGSRVAMSYDEYIIYDENIIQARV